MSLAEARKGHALLALSRLEEARAAYEAALALAEGGPSRLKVEALGGLAALGSREAYGEMVRLARASGDLWVEGFLTLAVALAWLRRGEAFPLPPLELLDPFLREVAEAYPFADGWEGLLLRYPFLAAPTLFAPPLPRLRRALWRLGRLPLAYHPGVRLEVRALGAFRVLVDGRPVRFRREKARLFLALLAARDFEKKDLLEALEASPGEFRVLWWEVVNALEPGRPKGAPLLPEDPPLRPPPRGPRALPGPPGPQGPPRPALRRPGPPGPGRAPLGIPPKAAEGPPAKPGPRGVARPPPAGPPGRGGLRPAEGQPPRRRAEGLRRAALRELGL